MSLENSVHTKVYDEWWPDREWEDRYNYPGFGYDIVYKAGPHDWNLEGADQKSGIKDKTLKINDYCIRKKIYLHGHEVDNTFPEIKYFNDIRTRYLPELESVVNKFSDQTDIKSYIFQLMLIEYSNNYIPEGKEDDYWSWNFEKFGLPHCDESLGGLHLGENLTGFYIDKPTERVYYDLTKDKTLWFWGQEAEASGFIPTTHGVEYLKNSNGKNRYSVIFNLKSRRK